MEGKSIYTKDKKPDNKELGGAKGLGEESAH